MIIIQWSKFDPHSAESEIKAEFLNVYSFCIIMKSLLSVTAHVLFYSQWKISNDHLAFFSSSLQNNQKLRNHSIIQVSSYLAENDFQVDKKSFSKPTRFSFGSDQFWGQNLPHEHRKCKKICTQRFDKVGKYFEKKLGHLPQMSLVNRWWIELETSLTL